MLANGRGHARRRSSATRTQNDSLLDFLFRALDVWDGRSITETFDGLFAGTGNTEVDTTKVRLYFRSEGGSQEALNMFETCCRS